MKAAKAGARPNRLAWFGSVKGSIRLSFDLTLRKNKLPERRGKRGMRFGPATEPGLAFVHLILGARLPNRSRDFLRGVLLGWADGGFRWRPVCAPRPAGISHRLDADAICQEEASAPIIARHAPYWNRRTCLGEQGHWNTLSFIRLQFLYVFPSAKVDVSSRARDAKLTYRPESREQSHFPSDNTDGLFVHMHD